MALSSALGTRTRAAVVSSPSVAAASKPWKDRIPKIIATANPPMEGADRGESAAGA